MSHECPTTHTLRPWEPAALSGNLGHMERVIQTHQLGPHRVDVVESADDEGIAGYIVLADDIVLTDPMLQEVPDLEEVVRVYAAWQDATSAG